MCLVDALAIPLNLYYKHFQELNKAVTKHRTERSRTTIILYNKAIDSNDATLLRLLSREAEKRAHLNVFLKQAEV
jgi:hypothetical protein